MPSGGFARLAVRLNSVPTAPMLRGNRDRLAAVHPQARMKSGE
jgi:hypothetical protein